MKQILILGLVLGLVNQCSGQKKYKITGMQLGVGPQIGWNYMDPSDWNRVSKNIKDDFSIAPYRTDQYDYRGRISFYQPFLNVSLSVARMKDGKIQFPNRELRLGLSVFSKFNSISSYEPYSSYNTKDTQPYTTLNYYETFRFLGADIAMIRYTPEFWRRFRLFSGFGGTAAFSVNDAGEVEIDTVYFTRQLPYNYYSRRSYTLKRQVFDLKPAMNLFAYIPIGLSFRLSKRIDLSIEERPSLYYFHVFGGQKKTDLSNAIFFSARYKI